MSRASCVFLPLSSYVDVPRMILTEIAGWTNRPDEMAVLVSTGTTSPSEASARFSVDSADRDVAEIVDLVIRDADDWFASGILVNGARRFPRPDEPMPDAADALSALVRRRARDRGQAIRVGPGECVVLAGVTYVGQGASSKFLGCAIARSGDPDPGLAPISPSRSVPRASGVEPRGIRVGDPDEWLSGLAAPRIALESDLVLWRAGPILDSMQVEHRVKSPMRIDSLEVHDHRDWIVNDVKIDGRSLMLYPGDIPSEALMAPAGMGMHLGVARRSIELAISYVGSAELGSQLRCDIHTNQHQQGREDENR